MTSKKIVYGKHPLTVRLSPELYKEIRLIAAEQNKSVQEVIVDWCKVMTQRFFANRKE